VVPPELAGLLGFLTVGSGARSYAAARLRQALRWQLLWHLSFGDAVARSASRPALD